ncbi:MAG TPA: hypothetical protein VFV99_08570 [Kofleriaceae bacterium]|nr:hypothetical protein [Kofleriaceae bacterium]
MSEPWDTAAAIAAWAPDATRELLANAVDLEDEFALPRASELMAKAFAVTGVWDLARDTYALAADTWEALDAARARALRELVQLLPLVGFANEHEAIEAERMLVRSLDARGVPLLVLRALTEIRRAILPRQVTGLIEATFELAPMQHAFVMALALDSAARLTMHEWQMRLRPSVWFEHSLERTIELGLVHTTPVVTAHPRLVSRLHGRTVIEMPRGVRYEELEPTQRGLRRFRLHAIGNPLPEALLEAAIEIGVHGGVVADDGVSSPP